MVDLDEQKMAEVLCVYREVQVSVDEPQVRPMAMMRAQAMDAMKQEALPVEAGKANVTATVSGSVQMK